MSSTKPTLKTILLNFLNSNWVTYKEIEQFAHSQNHFGQTLGRELRRLVEAGSAEKEKSGRIALFRKRLPGTPLKSVTDVPMGKDIYETARNITARKNIDNPLTLF